MEVVLKEDFDTLLSNFAQLSEEFKNFKEDISNKHVTQRYLNQKQVVLYTGKSPKTINEWVLRKGLKQIIVEENSNPVYDVKDLDEFMEKHKIKD